MNRSVALYFYGKVDGKWRRGPAVIRKNGKVAPGLMLLDGGEIEGQDGHYEVIRYCGKRRVRISVGTDPVEAIQAQERIRRDVEFKRLAEQNGYAIPELQKSQRRTLQQWRDEFLRIKQLEDHKTDFSFRAHQTAIDELLKFSAAAYPEEVSTGDLLGYARWLTDSEGHAEATRANRMQRCFSFLKFCGIDILKPEDRPLLSRAQKAQSLRYTKKLPTVYESAEIKKMLQAAGRFYNRALILFAVSTGFRDQEIQFLGWEDIDFRRAVVSVVAKPNWGFIPKDYEERSVPLARGTVNALLALEASGRSTPFVFATSSGRPNTKLLNLIKRVARRANLNCGHCKGCLARRECSKFSLHKFRRTYITRLLRQTDLRTVMRLAGHSDIESTMRYLRPNEGKAVQDAVNDAFVDVGRAQESGSAVLAKPDFLATKKDVQRTKQANRLRNRSRTAATGE